MRATRPVKNLAVIFFLCAAALAQSPAGETKHFNKEGLSFDYPAGWTLTDKSTPQAQHLILTRAGSSALIMVIAHRDIISTSEQLAVARDSLTIPFVRDVAQKFGLKEAPVWEHSLCAKVGGHQALGFLLRGQVNKEPSTGEIYTLVLGQRFVNAVYIRSDKDDAVGSPAWQLVRDSLKAEGPPGSESEVEELLGAGVLNGRAIELPKPAYPNDARREGVSGTVVVQVKIDEEGKVYAAEAVSGPSQLRIASMAAARLARFTPTVLCDRPVKVIGVITYDYVR
jgi:TonB family protein